MKRYRIENGVPILPPRGAVTVDGRVVSNFAGRIERDASFAAAHGYYPIKEETAFSNTEGELLEGGEEAAEITVTYALINGAWVRTVA